MSGELAAALLGVFATLVAGLIASWYGHRRSHRRKLEALEGELRDLLRHIRRNHDVVEALMATSPDGLCAASYHYRMFELPIASMALSLGDGRFLTPSEIEAFHHLHLNARNYNFVVDELHARPDHRTDVVLQSLASRGRQLFLRCFNTYDRIFAVDARATCLRLQAEDSDAVCRFHAAKLCDRKPISDVTTLAQLIESCAFAHRCWHAPGSEKVLEFVPETVAKRGLEVRFRTG